jgi:hypothetical protein
MLKVLLCIALSGTALALCTDQCLGDCIKTDTFENCSSSCGCESPESTLAVTIAVSPSDPPSASQVPLKALPLSPPQASPQSSPEQESPVLKKTQVSKGAGKSVEEQFTEQYKARGCGFRCVAMCEKLASIDCIDYCEDMFCTASVAFAAADVIQADYHSLSSSGWCIRWVPVVIAIAGGIYWTRFGGGVRKLKHRGRRTEGGDVDTYYSL